MQTKKLVSLILGIIIIGAVIFGYLYYRGRNPLVSQPENVIKPTMHPKFLYAINNEPAHPLDRPMAVLVANSQIYVSDFGTGQVSVFDYNGKFKHYLKPGNEKFVKPYGLAFDGTNLYVADNGTGKIFVFDAKDQYLKIFPAKGQTPVAPTAMVFFNHKLYVSDVQKQQVLVFNVLGEFVNAYGSAGNKQGQLEFPHGIAVNNKGLIYVADSGNNRITVFHENGSALPSIGSADVKRSLLTPRGLSMDQQGNLWVVSGLADLVKVYSPNGNLLTEFGGVGSDYGQVSLPNGIFIDANNRIYVTETGNSRISVFGF